MFVVELTYIQPLAAVEAHSSAHREFLLRMSQAGTFLLAGRKATGDGGIALASANSLQELESVLAQDPFHIHGVASYQVREFFPGIAVPALQSLIAA